MTTSNEHNNAPSVPQGEPIACLVRHRRLQTPKRLAHDGQDHFSEWSDWRPETLKYGEAVTDPLRNSGPECLFEMQPLYATPAPAPAVPQEVGLTDEEITQVCSGIYLSDHPQGSASYDVALARAIIAAHEAKQATAAPEPAQEIDKSVADAEIKAMYVESQGSDKGWLGIEGSYFIGGVVAARRQKKATKPAQGEPFGYFRVEPFGWTDCAKDDEGAIALYERPQEVGLTDEEIEAIAKKHMSTVGDHWCNEEAIREIHAEDFARAIIAALRAKGGKHV